MTTMAKAIQQELDLGLPGEVTPVSYTLPADMEYDQWEQAGRLIARIGRASRWWIGDWLLEGEARFGEKASQLMDSLGLEYSSLSNIAWVAKRVPPEVRREDLSWSHHEVVAVLERPEDQVKWLARAAEQGWKRDELRAHLKGKEVRDPDADAKPRAALSPARQGLVKTAIEATANRWWNGLTKDREVEKLVQDQAFRAGEFERLANLGMKAVLKALGSGA